MRKILASVFCVVFCVILAGCSTMPAKQAANNQKMSWVHRQNQLANIQNWKINGAVSITNDGHGQTASVVWTQVKNHYDIAIYGPFGAGRVTLTGQPNSVILTSGSKRYYGKSPEAVMRKILGWSLPVSHLVYWIRGIPAPLTLSETKLDHYNHLEHLQQDGWLIDYLRYTGVAEYDLPSKLELTRDKLHVRLVMSSYSV
jgi:outer membrane lipoprotein LolB